MALYKSGEDYLETILLLHKRSGFVRAIDVATEMGYSKPSVSRAVSNLKADGLIDVAADGQITLTKKGEDTALSIYDRHENITLFLTQLLGVSDETAQEDACKIEHVLSDETFAAMKNHLKKHK